jgi:hypothetical protein
MIGQEAAGMRVENKSRRGAAAGVLSTAICFCVAACSSPERNIETYRKAGDVKGLMSVYETLKRGGKGTDALKALSAVGSVGGKDAEDALLALRKNGDGTEREQALRLLAAMKSKDVVPDLVAILLNSLQTGSDGKKEAEAVTAINPDALKMAYAEMRRKAEEARKAGSAFAADQYIQNADALSRLTGGGDLSGEKQGLEALKKEQRLAELAEKLVDAMENGQCSRPFEIAKAFSAATDDAALRGMLPEFEKLSRLEDKFYDTARAQESANAAYDASIKAGVPGPERDRLLKNRNTEKGNMVLIRRALERDRKKLPLMTEKVREIAERYGRQGK